MEFIREATVKIIGYMDLRPGDKILYSDIEVTVSEDQEFDPILPIIQREVRVYQFNDPTATMTIGPFRHYYRIIDAIKFDGCISIDGVGIVLLQVILIWMINCSFSITTFNYAQSFIHFNIF